MDKAKILRLCNEIEDEISEAWNCDVIEYDKAGHIISIARKIAAEITAPPKSNGDLIRQMTDEELAYFLTTTSCSICCDHPLNCGFECASLYEIKAAEQASLLDRLAAEYDRKHPNGLKLVYSLDGETQQTEQEEKENG